MFDQLTEKLSQSLRKVRGSGRLNEYNIHETLKEVKRALLEADVNFRVVKAFLRSVQDRALGEEVQVSLTPGQQFIKIVNEELTEMMGGGNADLSTTDQPPLITMLVGLQGSGKTSSVGKLALHCTKQDKKTYLIPADVYRPAAIEQLQVLARTLNVPCFHSSTDQDPVEIVKQGLEEARQQSVDNVFIDTAGRLQIDEILMDELERIKKKVDPNEVLFVADAMTGQEAVNVAKGFNDHINLTGIILTKMDGDARGGAALSIRAITKKPIKFITTGEKLEDIEAFHPDRVASRILGMGDLLSLIEKVESTFSEKEALQVQAKLKKNEFTLDDFRDQLRSMQKMGSMSDIIKMLPGVNSAMLKNSNFNEGQITRINAILGSMTLMERNNHNVMNGSRRLRIAKGSGTRVSDVNRLIKQFVQMRKMMNKLSKTNNPEKALRMMQGKM